MAERRPLVRINGQSVQLPMGDFLPHRPLYPKTYVGTTSGTFTLPATALPAVDALAVGGGSGGHTNGGTGGNTTISDALGNVLLEAEGGAANRPGRGGGIGAYQGTANATSGGAPAQRGVMGYGNGGGVGNWTAAGSGLSATNAAAGTGDGGGGNPGATSRGGCGGGVTKKTLSLTPGATYTHAIGSGGSAGTSAGAGGSGRVEYQYWDTVP
jgi:hypothetical protein